MYVTVNINDVNYSQRLLGVSERHVPGIEELEYTTEDDEGRAGIPSARINLSDIKGTVNTLLNASDTGNVILSARNMQLYQGILDCPNFNYDEENDIVTVKSIGYDAKVLSELETKHMDKVLGTVNDNGTVSQYGGVTLKVNYRSVADPGTEYAYRKFWSVQELVQRIFNAVGVTVTVKGIDDDIYIGGRIMGSGDGTIPLHYYDIAPKDSAKDFLSILCKLFHSVWWMTSPDTAIFSTKIAQITTVNNTYPGAGYDGKILKGQTRLKLNQNGYDSISINPTEEHGREPGDTRSNDGRTITRTALNLKSNNIQVNIKFPTFAPSAPISIPVNIDEPYYILRIAYIRGVSATPSGIWPNEILNKYHSFELKGTHEVDLTYSLLGADSLSSSLFIPYMRLTPMQLYPNDFSTYYIRNMSLDPHEETLNAKAIGYWL